MTQRGSLLLGLVCLVASAQGCATGDRLFVPDDEFYEDSGAGATSGSGGTSGSSSGGTSGSSSGGTSGSSSGGTSGSSSGGTSGSSGAAGTAGASATGGAAGSTASGGASGSAGSGGVGGSGGTGGTGGSAGSSGASGSAGSGGAGGSAGSAGSGGVGGSGGTGGTGGSGGITGTGGAGGSGGSGGSSDPCSPDPCNAHGSCRVISSAASCTCDEGFDAPNCLLKNALYGQRVKAVTDLADPDVLDLGNGTYLMGGTGSTGKDLPLYSSSDFNTWTKTTTYDPSARDTSYDYCDLWSPELVLSGGKLSIYFSGYRGPNGATFCPPPPGYDRTMFRADSPDATPNFGPPSLLFQSQGGAASRLQSGCPAGGCGLAIRIDPAVHAGRLYYVFFQQGNNVGSVSLTDPTDFVAHTGPADWTLPSYEESVNEAPELYSHAGREYLFFSGAVWNSQYATYYLVSNTTAPLTRDLGVSRLSTPVRRGNGTLAETQGSNSIVERFGEAFNFFGLGIFDGTGHLTGRDTYRQRLVRNEDGTLESQNQVVVSWNSLGSFTYSLDVVLRDGSVIGPCIAVGRIGGSTSATFTGICPDANDRLVHKSKVQTFRLFASPGGNVWSNVGELAYDGYSDTVSLTATAP